MTDVYNADKRAAFTTCTGIAVPNPNFGKTIPDHQGEAAVDVATAENAK